MSLGPTAVRGILDKEKNNHSFEYLSLPSSSMERCRMMTGVVYAGVRSGTPEGVAYPQGTGTEYPDVMPSCASASCSLGSAGEDAEGRGACCCSSCCSWIGEMSITE